MLESECGQWAEDNNNGCLTNQELSDQSSRRDMLSAFKAVAEAATSDSRDQTQDGVRCSDTRM